MYYFLIWAFIIGMVIVARGSLSFMRRALSDYQSKDRRELDPRDRCDEFAIRTRGKLLSPLTHIKANDIILSDLSLATQILKAGLGPSEAITRA